MRRPSLSPLKPRFKAYFHLKIPVSNSDFDGGDRDPDGASTKGGTEEHVGCGEAAREGCGTREP
ncbi:hypothetical protein CXB51_029143 [Gossypium anomalum]|uniref:Uncharacterized protein n=1 Tax=Gossypium anomalum TaxID=47600 RepID=A0A8J5Y1D5_9ROSI|nr:hypothetical protein CXB51_029143 [Gossypium anomalum]